MDEFSKCIATTSNNDLPYELITEILLRLPVKSLLKMRSVSKSWLSLISSHLFIRSHLEFSAKNREFPNHRLLFIRSRVKYTCSLAAAMCKESRCIPVELDFACEGPFPKICTIWGSCDGLFCISSVLKELFLWNPSIKKLKKLPPSLNDVGYGTYGLGYVECCKDYRILEIRGECSTVFRNVVNVYSLRTNSWKRIRRYAGVSFGDQPGILVNGILHHKAYRGDCFISSFNFVDEIFGDVALPNPALFGDVALLNPSEFNWRLGTLGGNLCVYSHPADATDVWVMMEYGHVESWIKVFSIPSYLIVRPIFLPDDESLLLLRRRSKLRWYNSRDNTFSHPDENKIWCDALTTFHLYIESLVSPSFPEEVEELRINE